MAVHSLLVAALVLLLLAATAAHGYASVLGQVYDEALPVLFRVPLKTLEVRLR